MSDAGVLEHLLRLQEHDSAIDRLRHRRRTLPELGELATLQDDLAALEASMTAVAAARDAAAAEQRRREDELSQVEAKVTGLERRLYSGQVNIPRELQAMQADAEALRRRRSVLEDGVLEAMAELEPLEASVDELGRRRGRMDERAGQLQAAIAQAQITIDAELDAEMEAREQSAAALPADLTARYERLRPRLDGVAVARLVNGRCGGCHLALPSTELDRIRHQPPDAIVLCEQCGRILVR